jgi:dynein heavy chain
MESCIITG